MPNSDDRSSCGKPASDRCGGSGVSLDVRLIDMDVPKAGDLIFSTTSGLISRLIETIARRTNDRIHEVPRRAKSMARGVGRREGYMNPVYIRHALWLATAFGLGSCADRAESPREVRRDWRLPRHERPCIAVFDADGTLWKGDVGESFFQWQLEHRSLLPDRERWAREEWKNFQAGKRSETQIWSAVAACQAGLSESAVQAAAARFFAEQFTRNVFPEVTQVVRQLQDEGSEVWICSASHRWIVAAGAASLGIPAQRVIAVDVEVVDGKLTDRVVEPVPYGPGKKAALLRTLSRKPEFVFGNSMGDFEMLGLAQVQAVTIDATPELAKQADERRWLRWVPQ